MVYTSRFNINDTVWMVRYQHFTYIVKCAACAQTGKVTLGDEEFICPKCSGRSSHVQHTEHSKYYVYGSTRVGLVNIRHCPDSYHRQSNEPEIHVTYMLEETGIGSGQIWNYEGLFASEAEAQAYCDLKNSLLPADECELGEPAADRFGRVTT